MITTKPLRTAPIIAGGRSDTKKGFIVVRGANAAAGDSYAEVKHAPGEPFELISLLWTCVSDANVGNRIPDLQCVVGNDLLWHHIAGTAQAASLTRQWVIHSGSHPAAVSGTRIVVPGGALYVPQNGILRLYMDGGFAGDTINTVFAFIRTL